MVIVVVSLVLLGGLTSHFTYFFRTVPATGTHQSAGHNCHNSVLCSSPSIYAANINILIYSNAPPMQRSKHYYFDPREFITNMR